MPHADDHGFHRVLVATDFSAGATAALSRAARLPLRRGATLYVLHVLPAGLSGELRAHAEREAGKLLAAEIAAGRTAAHAARAHEVELVPAIARGRAATEILRECRERDADLVVVGRHGVRPVRDLFIGATAERVVREALAPVLVVHGRSTQPYRRPLVGVELAGDRRGAQGIVDLAVALCGHGGVELALAHAFGIPFEGVLRRALTAEELARCRRESRAEAATAMRALLSRLSPGGARLRPVLRFGDPRTVLPREIDRRRIDLVVVGTHGRGAVARHLLGSVAESVLRAASCDVAVRRPRGARSG